MKHALLALALLPALALAQEVEVPKSPPSVVIPNPAPAAPAAPPPVTDDFRAGFCSGYNSAAADQAARVRNWQSMIEFLIVPSSPTSKGAAAMAVNAITAMALGPLHEQVTLSDGRKIDCSK